jgi:hypothetical protein
MSAYMAAYRILDFNTLPFMLLALIIPILTADGWKKIHSSFKNVASEILSL